MSRDCYVDRWAIQVPLVVEAVAAAEERPLEPLAKTGREPSPLD
jgi:hypothetical protein